jgi:hypothetical protein
VNANRNSALKDRNGLVLFHCAACSQALTSDDLGDFGLRPPRPGETADDYCDEELLDPRELRHLRCLDSRAASAS